MIVCIEGPSGAGKSTLADRLHGVWGNFQICPTVDRFLGSFPICQSEIEIEENFQKFIAGEARAFDFMRETGGNWIQDRNWVSQLTFLEAIEHLTVTDLTKLKVRIVELLESRKLVIPSTFIYLQCPPKLTATRRKLRGTTEWGDVPPWVDPKFRPRFRKLRHQSYEDMFRSTFPETINIDSKQKPENSVHLKAPTVDAQFIDPSEIVLRLRSRILS